MTGMSSCLSQLKPTIYGPNAYSQGKFNPWLRQGSGRTCDSSNTDTRGAGLLFMAKITRHQISIIGQIGFDVEWHSSAAAALT